MDFDSKMELYEAVYIFNRIYIESKTKLSKIFYNEDISNIGILESTFKAVLRILAVNNLIDFDGKDFFLSDSKIMLQQNILEEITSDKQKRSMEDMYKKAITEKHFFFDNINELEYEIYSRCNFAVTYKNGKEIAKHIDFQNKKVLELGGNSGGLGSAVSNTYPKCEYTIVDTKIPCMVGNEFNDLNEQNILFVEDDVFELNALEEVYDYVVIMNLLHDFDDKQCSEILGNTIQYCNNNTKFIIIEDILENEFEPIEVVMHGLRLAIECRGGKQRTVEEFIKLFSGMGYEIDKKIQINNVHTMLVFKSN